MNKFTVLITIALLFTAFSAGAQSVFDGQGHYLGDASQVRGYTANELVQRNSVQSNRLAAQAATRQGYETRREVNYGEDYNQNQVNDNADGIRYIEVPVTGVRQVNTIEQVEAPTTQCRNTYGRSSGNVGGTLLGSVIGGVLGHQIGHGRGRTAATVGGAVIGGGIGYNVSNPRRNQQQCFETTTVRNIQTSSYQVSFLYRGRSYVTQMNQDPGRTVQIDQDAIESMN